MGRKWFVIFGCLFFLSSCYSAKYYNKEGKVFRIQNEAADEAYIDSATVLENRFILNEFLKEEVSASKPIQFVLPSDIHSIVDEKQKLLLIVYYPNCGGATRYIELAKYAESRQIPYMLLSKSYHPDMMKRWNNYFKLKPSNIYIIPSGTYFYHRLLAKTSQYLGQVSPEKKREYQDDLMFVDYLILEKAKPAILGWSKDFFDKPNLSEKWLDDNWQ